MGMGMRGKVWRPQIQGLSGRHRLLTFDNRGIGESDASERGFQMRDLADDCIRLVDELGWDRFHLVGVSLGGMVAQHVAMGHQERLISLSLIATQPGGRVAWVPPMSGIRSWVRVNTRSGSGRLRAMQTLLYPPEFLASVDQTAMRERLADMAMPPAPRKTVMRQLRAVMGHRAGRRLKKVRVPTLVVRPGRDSLVWASHSETLAKLLPNSRLVRFDDAGHGVTFQEAEALNRELLAHFAEAEQLA
jgi:pimeloyl-ACP methyl ester carboxylesterase